MWLRNACVYNLARIIFFVCQYGSLYDVIFNKFKYSQHLLLTNPLLVKLKLTLLFYDPNFITLYTNTHNIFFLSGNEIGSTSSHPINVGSILILYLHTTS